MFKRQGNNQQGRGGNGGLGNVVGILAVLFAGLVYISGVPTALGEFFAHQIATSESNVSPEKVAKDCPGYYRDNRKNWHLAWCDRYAFFVPESGKFDAAKASLAVTRWRDANFDRPEECGGYVTGSKAKRAELRNSKSLGWCEVYLDKFPGKGNYNSTLYNAWLDANRNHACFDPDEDMDRAGEKGCREAITSGDVEVWNAGL